MISSCTDYKSRLTVSDQQGTTPPTGASLPQPAEERRSVWRGEKITGWVKLRVDVSETGEVDGIDVVEASDQRLETQAEESLSSWPFKPGTRDGKPARFEDVEFVMMFYTDDTTTSGEAIGVAILVIVALPVVLALAILGGGGSIKFGK
jgi:TonB family protein